MRTLNAGLEAAFDSLHVAAYIRVHIGSGDAEELAFSVKPLKYKLSALEASVTCQAPSTDVSQMTKFYIERGAILSGTPETIKSAFFRVRRIFFDGRLITLEGHVFQHNLKASIGLSTYETEIESVLSDSAIIDTYEDDTDAWLDYRFLPSGRVLNDNKYFFTLLRQKYLIFAREEGHSLVGGLEEHFSTLKFFVASETLAVQYTITDQLFKFNAGSEQRYFLWRDEAGTIHTEGSNTLPLHNLGYIESTDDPPPNVPSPLRGSKAVVPIHLKYQTGDYVTINSGGSELQTFTGRIEVTEILDTSKEPAWYCEIEPLNFFSNTEGGALPSTIERVAAYTPLVTSNFDGLLDETVNNLQAFADKVDDLFSPIPGDGTQYLGGDLEWHPLPTTISMFLSSTNSDIGGYETLSHTRPTGAETSASASISAADTVIEEFIHAAGEFDFISAQELHCHIHLAKTAGVKDATAYVKAYHRTAAGTETLLATSEVSGNLTGSNTAYDFDLSIEDTEFAATDRFLIKVFASPNGSGTTPTVTLYFEGTTDSRIEIGTFLTPAHTHKYTLTFGSHAQGGTVAARPGGVGTSTTAFLSIFNVGFVATLAANPLNFTGTLKNLKVRGTSGAQPASGDMTVTINVGGSATALTLTIPAGSTGTAFENLADDVAYAAGDLIRIDCANFASAASKPLGLVTFDIEIDTG
jgi:hypothetical protein